MKYIFSVFYMFLAVSVFAQASATNSESPTKVYIAATGDPEQLPTILDGITDYLSNKGVSAKQLSDAPKSRGVALDELNQKHGEYLLFLTLDFAPGQNMVASLKIQARDAAGKLLWEEETKGGMLMVTKSGYIKSLIKKSCKKLDAHIGGEGLPKDAP